MPYVPDSEELLAGAGTASALGDRLRALLQSAPVGIYETSLDGAETYANERARRLAGLPTGAIDSMAWLEALHPDDREWVAREWSAAFEQDREFEAEYRFLHPDGTVVWVVG